VTQHPPPSGTTSDARLGTPAGESVDAALGAILRRTASAGVAVVDRELRYVQVNEALALMNGMSAEAHVGKHLREVLPPASAELLVALLHRVVDTGEATLDRPVRVFMPDGRPRHFFASYHPTFDQERTVTGLVCVVVERTAVEMALRESEARLRRVAESGIVGMFFWGMEGEILEANDAFLQMLGYTQADLAEGRVNWRAMTPPEYAAADETALAELHATGRHGQVPKEYVGKDGQRVPVIVTSALLDHSTDRGVCVCLDATVQRRVETEHARLHDAERAARARADEANRAKSEFLAVMSHELRTPLNAIAGYADLLDLGVHGSLNEPQRDAIARIQRSQRHLLGLINHVLSFARIEAGHLQLDIVELRVHDALAALEILIAPQVQRKALVFEYDGCDPRITVYADGDKLRQILLNLLSNAVKFTPPGGRISLSCTADAESARIAVADTGRGIPAGEHERIFEPFVQLDASSTRAHEGTGLGLAISRDLARAMNGELTVESTLGEGSVFTLRLSRP
jgi:PAS domain S-box-containing protein